jgi:hypothetical protein
MTTSSPLPLEPLPYHQDLVRHLREHEPELWAWFSVERIRAERDESVRLDLLRSTYRLEADAHPALHAAASEAGKRLGLDEPLTLYQAQGGLGLNGSLAYVPGEVHLVLHGPVGERLAPLELRAVLGHEITHFLLLDRWREFLVASQILAALTRGEAPDAAHLSTARRFNLYAEVTCDRGAYLASGDVAAAVAALVKIETGAAEASAESYLRQADEIFDRGRDGTRADGITHPEAFVRARAMKLWAEEPDRCRAELASVLEGPVSLADLDLLGQVEVSALTRRLISAFLRPASLRSGPLLAHARLFFEDFGPSDARDPPLPADLRGGDPTLLDYWCYLLLDFAVADRNLGGAPLAAAVALAAELGLGDRFRALAGRELGKRRKELESVLGGTAAPSTTTLQARA